jgi:hypothetical protein
MRRHHVRGFALLDGLEGNIARGTTGEGIQECFEGNAREYLLDLLLHPVAFYEQMVLGKGPVTEVIIPGQNHALLFERKTDDLIVVHCPIVEDI